MEIQTPHPNEPAYRAGIMLVIASTFAWSTAGLFVRALSLDSWAILFWRSLFAVLFIGAAAMLWFRRELPLRSWRLDGHGCFVVLCSTAGMVVFIPALKLTSVANVAVIYGTLPFVAAVIAWVWFGEASSKRTLLYAAGALCGVVVAVGVPTLGNSRGLGDILAFAMTVTMAIMTVAVRHRQTTPLIPMACLSNALCALMSFFLVPSLAVGIADGATLLLFGLVQMALGITLFTAGARKLPAADAALLSTFEMPMGPLWVWLVFSETPPLHTIAGGVLVMMSVVAYILGAPPLSRLPSSK